MPIAMRCRISIAIRPMLSAMMRCDARGHFVSRALTIGPVAHAGRAAYHARAYSGRRYVARRLSSSKFHCEPGDTDEMHSLSLSFRTAAFLPPLTPHRVEQHAVAREIDQYFHSIPWPGLHCISKFPGISQRPQGAFTF